MFEQIINFIKEFWPLYIVRQNELAIFLRCGKWKRNIGPGLYFRIPFIEEIESVVSKTQIVNLTNQSLTSEDGMSVAISGAIEYSISNPRKCLLDVQDFDESLVNLCLISIAKIVRNKCFRCDIDELETDVYDILDRRAESWGIDVTEFRITDYVDHSVLRILDMPTFPTEE